MKKSPTNILVLALILAFSWRLFLVFSGLFSEYAAIGLPAHHESLLVHPNAKIPRLIHQFKEGEELSSMASIVDQHFGWELRYWTIKDLDELFRFEVPFLYPLYLSKISTLARLDLAKYLILYLVRE
jgi:hypothetical protein